MTQIHFRSLDLNLLRVFDALTEEGSVTGAAGLLGLTPSAVSHSLNRLRHILKDDLFLRGAKGMNPTPKALALAVPIRRALVDIQQALNGDSFVPEKTDRRFSVACGDYITAVLMPEVIARFRKAAPLAELRILPVGAVMKELDAGRIDLALGGFERIPERLASEPLFADDMVWVMRSDNPFAGCEPTLEGLAALPHLAIASPDNDRAVNGIVSDAGLERRVVRDDPRILDQYFKERGLRRTIAMTAPNPIVAMAIVAECDLAAMMPRNLAENFAERYKLALWKPPHPSALFQISTVWHRWHGDQPAVDWLRAMIRSVAEERMARPTS